MRAFVLSGGGNLGPLQVGALRALFEAGITPQMAVGCSAGSLSAAPIAHAQTLETVAKLGADWSATRLADVYPGWKVGAIARFLAGKDSLYTNRNLYALLRRSGIDAQATFGDFATIPLYITATDLRTGTLKVFGDDPNDRIIDAMMSSTALTPFHPPWEVNGERYVDGGTITPLPIRVALERGATEVYALHIWDSSKDNAEPRSTRGVIKVLARSVDSMLRLQAQHDLLLARNAGIPLHYIRLSVPRTFLPTDFSHAQEMIDAGYTITQTYLASLPPAPAPVAAEQSSVQQTSVARRVLSSLSALVTPRQGAPI